MKTKKSGILQSSFHFLKWSRGFEVSQYIQFIVVFDSLPLYARLQIHSNFPATTQPPRYMDSTNELPWKFWYRILVTVIKTPLPQWNKTRYWTAETRQVSSNTLLSMFTIHWKIRMSQSSVLNKVPNHPQERKKTHTHAWTLMRTLESCDHRSYLGTRSKTGRKPVLVPRLPMASWDTKIQCIAHGN